MLRRLRAALFLLIAFAVPVWAQTVTISPDPKFTGFDTNGDPVSGGKLCTYEAGTSTPATTYSDNATPPTANANPTILDAAGRATVFLATGASYKFVLRAADGADGTCSTGTILWTVDGIGSVPANSGNLDVLGTAGEALLAGEVVYLSDGSGALTAGTWYKADQDSAYSSSSAIVGIVPNAISSGAVGTVRLGGQMTGLTALVVGSSYYVSATAGSLTATAPQNRRLVGVADSTTSLVFAAQMLTQGVPLDNALNDFRLTLTSGVPVTTADVTAATTIYLTPYKGNRIALYNALGATTIYTSGEMSITVPATTATMYDIFVYAGTNANPTLEVLAWTNDTTRATALVNNVAVGVYTKSGDATRRYVGSFRTMAVSGQTVDSFATRALWNYYHRVRRGLRVIDTTNSWTYTTAAYQQANASASNQVAAVVGVAESWITLRAAGTSSNSDASGGRSRYTGIGVGSTTVNSAQLILGVNGTAANPVATEFATGLAFYEAYPAVGYQFYPWLEYSEAAGTTTWYGDANTPTVLQTGLQGWIE